MTVVAETKGEIPEDVRERAQAFADGLVADAWARDENVKALLPAFFAKAILSERERCAKIADERAIQYAGRAKDAGRDGDADSYTGFGHRALASKFIASSIRSGAKP